MWVVASGRGPFSNRFRWRREVMDFMEKPKTPAGQAILPFFPFDIPTPTNNLQPHLILYRSSLLC